ncbi:phosphotransferase family protein [Sphingomonas mali]|uniref:phosphotransferase family protein n=1 Tax=Sphingomonas mali TaxID=40682 RepID=UPI000836540D|nr:phosphotransferase family protein [Sphingomonas mali]
MSGLPPALSFQPDLLDEAALTAWMERHVDGFRGPFEARMLAGGQSNPTFMLTTSTRAYVLRRRPPGDLPPGAHAVDREARVQMALARQGFPVPRIHAACADDSVIGSPFYIMDMVEGRIFRESTFAEAPPEQRAPCFDQMNAMLARLHAIDPIAAGLADFGRPGSYFARQVKRWARQYHAETGAGRIPDLDWLVDWLPGHIPADDETVIVHGDFRVDNMIFHPTEPRVVAVLDWELSTLGHPLADFTYLLMMYRCPPAFGGGIADKDPRALGLPDEDAYVAAYCRRTGRPGIPDLDVYMAYNLFRLGAIVHGIKGRVLRGNAVSANAARLAAELPAIAALARAQAERWQANGASR